MFSKNKADEYILNNKGSVNREFKPKFHFSAEIGWINDPNGFCRFNGQYHLFYQFYPYGSKWGPMHWGHAVSHDLIKWEHMPVALAPDSSFDKDGCFSGTAIVLDDKLYLFYTGVHDGKQEQCIAFSADGINFEKYADNPVIGEKNLAPDVNIQDFRDPKIIQKGEYFYCIIGANSKAVVYKSKNMFEWEYTGDLLDSKLGVMWECPDYFEADDETVFLASICGNNTENSEENKFVFFANPTYFVLESNDLENLPVKYKSFGELENGFDFYAPQVLQSPENKNILIAWMYTFGERVVTDSDNLNHGWANCMTLPREIGMRDGKLYQTPIKAIEKYRKNEFSLKDIIVREKFTIDEKSNDYRSSEMLVSVDMAELCAKTFKVILPAGVLAFDKENGFVIFDRSDCGYDLRSYEQREQNRREVRKHKFDFTDIINIQIFIDVSAYEVFINKGEMVISSRFYLKDTENYQVEFESDGLTKIREIKKYDIVIGE